MSIVKLPQFGNDYSGHHMRELVRQVEFALNELNRAIVNSLSIVNPEPGEGTPVPDWQVVLSNDTPSPLGIAQPGTSTAVSRADHVHRMPSSTDVGADATGTAAAAVAAHVAAEDPHPQYLLRAESVTPYSLSRIDVGEEVTIPRNANLLMYEGLDVRGSLNLLGALCDVSPDI